MKRKRMPLLLILAVALMLTACRENPSVTKGTGPGRMVRRIEVSIHPEDARFSRTYVTQENISEFLNLMRSMVTKEQPETEPDIHGGQGYYTATLTFANGEQTVYYLLNHTYLRLGDDPWCVLETGRSFCFTDFLREHPSDDGTVPAETTAPTE